MKYFFQKDFLKFAAVLLAFSITSCAKKRKQNFAQGQGINLSTLSDLDGKTFSLSTKAKLKNTSFSSSINSKLNDGKRDYNFAIVDYTTKAPNFPQIDLSAKENFSYELLYKLSNKFLTVYRTSKIDGLSKLEESYAEKIGSKFQIPIVQFSVSYIKVVNSLNQFNEKSHVIIEQPVNTKAEATHVRVDYLSHTALTLPSDVKDILHKSFFAGTWYYSKTIIDASQVNQSSKGVIHGLKITPAEKISIVLDHPEYIRGVNAVIPKGFDKSNINHYKTVLKLPVSPVNLTRKVMGNDFSNSYENNTNVSSKDKTFLAVNFKNVDYANSKELSSLELDNGYFSFVVTNPGSGVSVRYSLVRTNLINSKGFKPRVYHPSDQNKFGYFSSNLDTNSDLVYYQKDVEKLTLIDRHNTANKKITWYFTKNSPKEYRVYGRKIIAEWNKAFAKAKTDVQMVLNEEFDVVAGDIRYNAINLISTDGTTPLLGYGPRVVDAETGLIISATANIYITTMKSGIKRRVSDWLLLNNIGFNNVDLIKDAQLPLNFSSANLDDNSRFGMFSFSDIYTNVNKQVDSLKSLDKTLNQKSFASALNPSSIMAELNDSSKINTSSSSCSNSKNSFSTLAIKEKCPELLALNKSPNLNSKVKSEQIDKCVEELLPSTLVSIGLHEVGHAIGLRHNFMGFADKENYYASEETNTDEVVPTSSVMDYGHPSTPRLTILGSYDIAAVAFLYGNKVFNNQDKLIDISVDKSISAQVPAKEIKAFKYCEDIAADLGNDPLCSRFIAGSNYSELADFYIDDLNAYLAKYTYRHGRQFFTSENAYGKYYYEKVLKLVNIYQKWRDYLNQITSKSNPYFANFSFHNSVNEYEAYLESIKPKNPAALAKFEDLRAASRKVYYTLRNILYRPNQYCKVKDANNEIKLIEFEKIINNLSNNLVGGEQLRSCKSPRVAQWLADNSYTFVSEWGHSINSYRYDNNYDNLLDIYSSSISRRDILKYDVNGSEQIKIYSGISLASRFPLSMKLQQQNFYPNFLDEPDLREDYEKALLSRLFYGVNGEGKVSKFNNKYGLHTRDVLGPKGRPVMHTKATLVDYQTKRLNILEKKYKRSLFSKQKKLDYTTFFPKYLAESGLLSIAANVFIYGTNPPESNGLIRSLNKSSDYNIYSSGNLASFDQYERRADGYYYLDGNPAAVGLNFKGAPSFIATISNPLSFVIFDKINKIYKFEDFFMTKRNGASEYGYVNFMQNLKENLNSLAFAFSNPEELLLFDNDSLEFKNIKQLAILLKSIESMMQTLPDSLKSNDFLDFIAKLQKDLVDVAASKSKLINSELDSLADSAEVISEQRLANLKKAVLRDAKITGVSIDAKILRTNLNKELETLINDLETYIANFTELKAQADLLLNFIIRI